MIIVCIGAGRSHVTLMQLIDTYMLYLLKGRIFIHVDHMPEDSYIASLLLNLRT